MVYRFLLHELDVRYEEHLHGSRACRDQVQKILQCVLAYEKPEQR
jgi:hypothetical protein